MVGHLEGGDRDPGAPTINAENINDGPLGGADGDSGVPIINIKKHWRRGPWEVVQEKQERPPSRLKISMVPPWEVLTDIRECPPSTFKNVDGGPPGRRWQRSRSAHHQYWKRWQRASLGGADGDLGVSIINIKKHRWWPP
jgi:hypothetical protein